MGGNSTGNKGILLEAGTNELELLVFNCGGVTFGINVAKVKEIIRSVETFPIPCAPASIEGNFQIRDEVLTLINLAHFLGLEQLAAPCDRLVIIMEMNSLRCGVLIDTVEQIHRIRWENVEPPPATIAWQGTPITAIAKLGKRVVQVLDFESIAAELFGLAGAVQHDIEAIVEVPGFDTLKVLAADDSPTIRMGMANILKQSGFEDITLCTDGQHAWDTLLAQLASGNRPFDIVLSDIEMPRMDGLYLTMRIKEHPEMRHIPVILFSSIIREETKNKGEAVGADGQLTKFDVKGLVDTITACLRKPREVRN